MAEEYLHEQHFTERDIAVWTAGFFDGEGTISITRRKPNPHCQVPLPTYQLKAQLVNTDKKLISFIKEAFGGEIYKYQGNNRNSKPYWRILFYGFRATKFLKEIKPFLLSKYRHAKLGIEFQRRVEKTKKFKHLFDEKEVKIREKYYQEMKKLNKRGI